MNSNNISNLESNLDSIMDNEIVSNKMDLITNTVVRPKKILPEYFQQIKSKEVITTSKSLNHIAVIDPSYLNGIFIIPFDLLLLILFFFIFFMNIKLLLILFFLLSL
jgi:hypothetical protein